MAFERISLREENAATEAAVRKTVAALRAGKTVVLPTETVYGIAVSALCEDAVQRLSELKGRKEGHPFALAFSSLASINDFLFDMSKPALRMARRCWPGPVSLVLDASQPESEFRFLPESIRNAVSKDGMVGFRVPNHPFTLAVLKEFGEPVVLTSVNRTGRPEASSCDEIVGEFGSEIDLIVDDGQTSGAKPSTVLRIDGDRYTILRPGAIKEETLHRLSARMILFVCTGNTCRSPMAERICEKLLARRLGCSPDQLEEHGFVVLSAGIAAGYAAPASANAVEALSHQGLDLSDHHAQPLNETHVRFADHIFTMTRAHREAILSYWPGADTRLSVLRHDGGDISDPIGGPLSQYEACAKQIEQEIDRKLDEILGTKE